MKRSVFLVIAAVLALVFGIGLLFNSMSMMAMHGVTLDASGMFPCKILGAVLLGLTLTYWTARNAGDSPAMSGILMGGFLANVIQLIVAVMATTSGMMNSMGWSAVVIHAFLTIGFGYFAFLKKA
jgi:hypothetical protein